MKKFLRPTGFTLIELLITIAIIGILAGGAFVGINPLGQINKAKDANKRMAVSQLVTALELYATQNGDKYPQANSGWITTLVTDGELKSVPSVISTGSSSCAAEQNGYCYKTNASQTEAIVYAYLESSQYPSGTTPYFLWSSAEGKSGIYYSVYSDIPNTSGFIFGPSSSLTQGLAGWWKMNGNASDSSGNSNNGTVSGATLTTDRSGQTNKAYSFNGSTDYINVPDSSSLNINGASSTFTIAAWIKTSVANSGNTAILERSPAGHGSDRNYILGFWSSTFQGLISDNVDSDVINGTGNYADGSWHYGVFVLTANQLLLYADGSQIATPVTRTRNPASANVTTNIGRGQTYNAYFNGSIDDVRVYNRALSADEITNLYNAGPQ